ncbi:unnamed protein product [Rangifer tarandus platyrhynchus]|uniref:Uncharacterized protein n=1 Tax=Rangifer tarandus platyrhynchus TaxID=3082113 RepID=A0AC59YZN5_RANTA
MASAGPGELKVSPPQSSAPPGKAGRPFRHRGGGGSLKTPAVPRGFGPAGARDLEEAEEGGEGRAGGGCRSRAAEPQLLPVGPRMTATHPAAPSHPQLIPWMFGTDQLGRR